MAELRRLYLLYILLLISLLALSDTESDKHHLQQQTTDKKLQQVSYSVSRFFALPNLLSSLWYSD